MVSKLAVIHVFMWIAGLETIKTAGHLWPEMAQLPSAQVQVRVHRPTLMKLNEIHESLLS